ncbi:hypothetical protein ON010_g6515 [Phytophthora cinnamomi]|nr:hypothetical protein ON010_g6515 [Phytophthora cinnamomi]
MCLRTQRSATLDQRSSLLGRGVHAAVRRVRQVSHHVEAGGAHRVAPVTELNGFGSIRGASARDRLTVKPERVAERHDSLDARRQRLGDNATGAESRLDTQRNVGHTGTLRVPTEHENRVGARVGHSHDVVGHVGSTGSGAGLVVRGEVVDRVGRDAHATEVGGDSLDERLAGDTESRGFTTAASEHDVDVRALSVDEIGGTGEQHEQGSEEGGELHGVVELWLVCVAQRKMKSEEHIVERDHRDSRAGRLVYIADAFRLASRPVLVGRCVGTLIMYLLASRLSTPTI